MTSKKRCWRDGGWLGLMGVHLRAKRMGVRASLALGLVLLAWPVGAIDSAVRIAFAPPDGTTFVQTLRREIKLISEAFPAPETSVTSSQAEYVVRKLADGYAVTVRGLRPGDARLSAEVAELVGSVLSSATLVYELEPTGELRRVRGTEAAMEQVVEKLGIPRETVEQLFRSFGFESLQAYSAAVWAADSPLVPSVELPPASRATRTIPLTPELDVQAEVITSVEAPVACGASTCVRIDISVTSTAPEVCRPIAAFFERLPQILASMAARAGVPEESLSALPEVRVSNCRFQTIASRTVRPDTGLPQEGLEKRIYEATISIAGETPARIRREELRDLAYDYRR